LEYTGEDGKQYTPVVVHRAVLGSLERFIGVLIEHYQGNFPTWLAPVQVAVIPLSEQHNAYAEKVYKEVKSNRIRTMLDDSNRTLEYKIREAQMQKIPYMVILGKKESESGKVTIRDRSGQQRHDATLADFISEIKNEIKERASKSRP
jgi:threonyl-tRNA synthetase